MTTHLGPLLRPDAIAVLGASRDPRKWGQRVIRYSRAAGYRGEILAVNPQAEPGSIPNATVVSRLEDAGTTADLAFLALPRHAVLSAVEECCASGVKVIVVAASGFGESTAEGADLERCLVELTGPAGARIVGPNCFGVFSAAAGVNLTPFEYVPPGRVALVSQSGNVTAQLSLAAARAGIGFAHCIGVGNQLDVGFGDLLEEFACDPGTDAVALYVEGLPELGGDGFRLGLEHCRAADKPVVVIKAGVTPLAAAVAETHTRSLAADDSVWDAVLSQSGAIRVRSIPEMADVLQCALRLRPPGPRVAVITDGGGDSVLAMDALSSSPRLMPARFTAEMVGVLDPLLPAAAPRVDGLNPLTLDTAGGVEDDPEVLARCLRAVVEGGVADIVLVAGLFGTYSDQREAEVRAAEQIREIAAEHRVSLVFQSPLGPTESEPLALLAKAGIPFFESVDRALRALNRLAPDPGPERNAENATRHSGGDPDRLWPADAAVGLLRRHGVDTPRVELVSGADALFTVAEEIGYPVCLKTADPTIVHKSDVGGVHVGLANRDQLRQAAEKLWAGDPSSQLLVMPSFPPALEMLVGGFYDAHFGPVIVVGRGGVLTEIDADTCLVTGLVTAENVDAAIRQLRCYPVLRGYRASPPLAVARLSDIAVALGRAIQAEPTISVDLNPVLVYPDRCEIADIRVLSPHAAHPSDLSRR